MLSDGEKETLRSAVKSLAAVCDGAFEQDGAGFNASDTVWGKRLALLPDAMWSDGDYADASERCLKYGGQLGFDIPKFRLENKAEAKLFITSDGTSFVIRFPYSANMVAAVRSLPARWFDGGLRSWRVPFSQHVAVMEFAKRQGFTVSQEAMDAPRDITAVATTTVAEGSSAPKMASLVKGDIILQFSYDASLVAAVRQLQGRTFTKTPTAMWKAPATLENLQMVESIAETYGLATDSALREYIETVRANAENNLVQSSALDGDIEVPGLALNLMPFQRAGVKYAIANPKCIIADKMGLGKTPQAIATATATDSFPAVVVCPAHLKLNWAREINKWTPGKRIYILSGRANEALPEADWYIVNYDLLAAQLVYETDEKEKAKLLARADLAEACLSIALACGAPADESMIAETISAAEKLRAKGMAARKVKIDEKTGKKIREAARTKDILAINFKILIFDEAHYAKNPKAERSKAVIELVEAADRALWMTGTPVENRPSELLNALTCLGHLKALGGWRYFVTRYCGGFQDRFGWNIKGATNLDELSSKLRATCFIQRTKAEVLPELPAKQRSVVPLDIDNRAEYDRAEAALIDYVGKRAIEDKEFLEALEGLDPDEAEAAKDARSMEAMVRAERAEHLVLLANLKRIAANGKLNGAIDWMSNFLDTGEKLIVFAHHIEVQSNVFDALTAHGEGNGYRVVRLDPADTPEVQQAKVDAFQNDPTTLCIVCSLSAHAEGWTGTASSNVVFLEMKYSPGKHDQAEDRCYGRLNDPHGANAWYIIGNRTVDEDSWQMLEDKRAIADGSTGKAGVGAMLKSIKKRQKKK